MYNGPRLMNAVKRRKPKASARVATQRVATVLRLPPQRMLGRSARKRLPSSQDECAKCGSTYVFREPAFLHCRCCGSLARIPNGSLADQQLFELRSGLRLAV